MYIFEKVEDIVTPLPNNSVIKADCFGVFPYLKSESVDLILCDLPYRTTKAKWDTPIDLPTLWGHYERIIKPIHYQINLSTLFYLLLLFEKSIF